MIAYIRNKDEQWYISRNMNILGDEISESEVIEFLGEIPDKNNITPIKI